jgi:hypothetical protein
LSCTIHVYHKRQRWKPEGARQQGWLDAQHDVAARRETPYLALATHLYRHPTDRFRSAAISLTFSPVTFLAVILCTASSLTYQERPSPPENASISDVPARRSPPPLYATWCWSHVQEHSSAFGHERELVSGANFAPPDTAQNIFPTLAGMLGTGKRPV